MKDEIYDIEYQIIINWFLYEEDSLYSDSIYGTIPVHYNDTWTDVIDKLVEECNDNISDIVNYRNEVEYYIDKIEYHLLEYPDNFDGHFGSLIDGENQEQLDQHLDFIRSR